MIQQILLVLAFLGAVAYLVRLLIRQFRAETGCASGCGKCGLDVKAIHARLNAQNKTSKIHSSR